MSGGLYGRRYYDGICSVLPSRWDYVYSSTFSVGQVWLTVVPSLDDGGSAYSSAFCSGSNCSTSFRCRGRPVVPSTAVESMVVPLRRSRTLKVVPTSTYYLIVSSTRELLVVPLLDTEDSLYYLIL